jgi:hypothetical protein
MSLLLIDFFLTFSILPGRCPTEHPSFQTHHKKTCNRKSQHHPTKLKFPYRWQRLKSVGSSGVGYSSSSIREGNNLDRVFSIAKFGFTVELRFFLSRMQL